MRYLIIILLLFGQAYAQTQTATNYVFDSTHLKDTGQLGLRDAVIFLYKKFNQFTANPGVVVQATSKSTAVTLNKMAGQITMNASALAAGSEASFVLNNSFMSPTDIIIINIKSGGTAGSYLSSVGSISNGACTITISNASTASLSQAIVLNFLIIK